MAIRTGCGNRRLPARADASDGTVGTWPYIRVTTPEIMFGLTDSQDVSVWEDAEVYVLGRCEEAMRARMVTY